MIDWFILLVPLSVLPVFLIFGFVGCTLDRRGSPSPPVPSLRYLSGLNVAKIQVTMTVIGWDDSKSDIQSRSAVDIKPGGGVIEFSIDVASINTDHAYGVGAIGPDLTADCHCVLTILGNPEIVLPLDAHHDSLADFQLSGSGFDPNNYSLA